MTRKQVSDIDWQTWEPEERATLMFVVQAGRILLIRKKRGLGAGNINGPGGRIEPGETPLACAIRETQEELLITPTGIREGGELFFHAEDFPRIHAHVFVASGYEGTPTETEEADPLWFPVNGIPYEEMWADDQYWLPGVLSGSRVRGWFTFTGVSVVDYHIELVPSADAVT